MATQAGKSSPGGCRWRRGAAGCNWSRGGPPETTVRPSTGGSCRPWPWVIALSAAGRRAGAEVEADALAVGADVVDDPHAVGHPAVGGDDLELIGVGEGPAALRGERAAEPVRADEAVGVAVRVDRGDVVRGVGPGDVKGAVGAGRHVEDGVDAAAGEGVGGVRAGNLCSQI